MLLVPSVMSRMPKGVPPGAKIPLIPGHEWSGEVVAVGETDARGGFAYGTLTGHPVSGEEAFIVEHDVEGRVWFSVTAFSRPARWPAMIGGPATVFAQRLYAKQCGRALRKLGTVSDEGGQ